ncbi:winged helix-turn-helix domain-containing protein [Halobaculum halobium]|uniref:winged helix-turn-helix domain-containing protein n=1 Tax=Halobaculum halobium TaxID=3032281 RepID=UPI003612EAB3
MSRSAEEAIDRAGEADLDPAEAFALLGNETRIDILQSLHEATIERDDDRPVAFSELYDRTGLDDSAHFNYHLKQLLDHFVRKVECGDPDDGQAGSDDSTGSDDCVEGYEFRTPGWKVVRSVFAGTFTGRSEVGPFDAPGACYECGGDLVATYANELLTIACSECGRTPVNYSFPPGGSPTALPRSSSTRSTTTSATTTASRPTASARSAWAAWRRASRPTPRFPARRSRCDTCAVAATTDSPPRSA